MYLEHFYLKEYPFGLTPNPQFFYKLPTHHAAFNVLMMHLHNREGFLKIVGDVGAGKTMLCRMVLENLGENFVTAYIPNPDLESTSLRKALATELGVKVENSEDPYQLLVAINQKLIQIHGEGKQVVLLIDEAQALPTESLETLRLFTNLETNSSKLLQIVLFGQPELDVKLNQKSLRQLKQRISFSHRLSFMKYAQLDAYLYHRLKMAGHHGRETLFTFPARLYLFVKTKGVPRLINILCHKALMSSYGRDKSKVHLSDMRSAVKDTESVKPSRFLFILGLSLAAAGLALHFWRI